MKYSIVEWHNVADELPPPFADILFTIPSIYNDDVTIGFYDKEYHEFCSYLYGVNKYPVKKSIKWAYVPRPQED